MLRPNGLLVVLQSLTGSETTGWDCCVLLSISSTHAAVALSVCICGYCFGVPPKCLLSLYYFSVPTQRKKMYHLPRFKPQLSVQADILTWNSKLLGAALMLARWLLTTSQLTACSYPYGSAPPSQQDDAARTCSQNSRLKTKGIETWWGEGIKSIPFASPCEKSSLWGIKAQLSLDTEYGFCFISPNPVQGCGLGSLIEPNQMRWWPRGKTPSGCPTSLGTHGATGRFLNRAKYFHYQNNGHCGTGGGCFRSNSERSLETRGRVFRAIAYGILIPTPGHSSITTMP